MTRRNSGSSYSEDLYVTKFEQRLLDDDNPPLLCLLIDAPSTATVTLVRRKVLECVDRLCIRSRRDHREFIVITPELPILTITAFVAPGRITFPTVFVLAFRRAAEDVNGIGVAGAGQDVGGFGVGIANASMVGDVWGLFARGLHQLSYCRGIEPGGLIHGLRDNGIDHRGEAENDVGKTLGTHFQEFSLGQDEGIASV